MSPFVVSVGILVMLSAVDADISHLNGQNGYHYPKIGVGSLKLHSAETGDPAPTQYGSASYNDQLPNSYSPPPSGSPFGSGAPLSQAQTQTQAPVQTLSPPTRLSVPLQSPLLAAQKFGQTQFQTQPRFQQLQQPRTYQPQTYQPQTFQPQTFQPQTFLPQAYQTQAYQTFQTQSYQVPTFQQQTYQTPIFNAQTYPQQTLQPPVLATNQYSRGIATRQTQAQTQTQTQLLNNQEPIITKHFYVHAAPEDPEEDAGPRLVQVGRPRKNFKIIFIKTPTYSEKQQIIPVLPPTEEKTIVYVLSKKPTLDQNIDIPEPPPTQPSKPDVFFIKYKTKEEAEQAQQQIQAAYDQANLSGSSESIGQIAAQFASGSDIGSSSSSFGGQAATPQQNSNGGQYTSTSTANVKRNVAFKH